MEAVELRLEKGSLLRFISSEENVFIRRVIMIRIRYHTASTFWPDERDSMGIESMLIESVS